MISANNLSNLNGLFKEMYSEYLSDLLNVCHWNEEKTKYYYNEHRNRIMGLSKLVLKTEDKKDDSILLFELTDG